MKKVFLIVSILFPSAFAVAAINTPFPKPASVFTCELTRFTRKDHVPKVLTIGVIDTSFIENAPETSLGLEPIVSDGVTAMIYAYIGSEKPRLQLQLRKNGVPKYFAVEFIDSIDHLGIYLHGKADLADYSVICTRNR